MTNSSICQEKVGQFWTWCTSNQIVYRISEAVVSRTTRQCCNQSSQVEISSRTTKKTCQKMENRVVCPGMNLPKRQEAVLHTRQMRRKRLKTTQVEGRTMCDWMGEPPPKANYRLHTLPFTSSMAFFTYPEQKKGLHLNGNAKDPEYPKYYWERGIELEDSGFLTPGYTTEL